VEEHAVDFQVGLALELEALAIGELGDVTLLVMSQLLCGGDDVSDTAKIVDMRDAKIALSGNLDDVWKEWKIVTRVSIARSQKDQFLDIAIIHYDPVLGIDDLKQEGELRFNPVYLPVFIPQHPSCFLGLLAIEGAPSSNVRISQKTIKDTERAIQLLEDIGNTG
jgi:hypothetical protein